MEITLVRHGRSTWTENNPIYYKEVRGWIEQYDSAGVFEEISYPPDTLKKVTRANLVLTSDLRRSIDSAKLLRQGTDSISTPLFRETQLPTFSRKLGGASLKPSFWIVLLRCLWLAGCSAGCESFRNAKRRAKQASEVLDDYARNYDTVVLVGHGFFNMLIAKELQKMGWKGERKTASRSWSCTTLLSN